MIVLARSCLAAQPRPRRLLRPAVRGAQPGAEGVPRRAAGAGQAGARLEQSAAASRKRPSRAWRWPTRSAPSPTGAARSPRSRATPRPSPSPSRSGRQVSLYAFNDWTLAFAGLGRRPLLHTIARGAAAGPFRRGHRGAKNLAARRTRDALRADGRDRGLRRVRSLPPVRQERCGPPPVPAGAALRGAHRGPRGIEEEVERIFGCRLSPTIFPTPPRNFRSSPPTSSPPRSISPRRPACACWPRAATRSMPRSPAPSPSPWSSRP